MASFRINPIFFFSFLLLLGSLRPAFCLEVTPGSSCASICMDEEGGDPFSPDSSSTNATDIVCQDSKFANDAVGIKYKSCLECLQKSQKTNGTESDISWLLYNLRFALGTCLYGFEDKDKVINSPCVINWACEPLKDAILDKNLDPDSGSLDYCTASNSALFGKTLKSCVACLKSSDDETYLGNFLVALQVGCTQKAAPGSILGISASPFTRSALEVTDSSGDDEEDKDPGASPNSLTTGTIVGIAIGAALFVFGGFALWFVYRKKKRSTSMDQDQNGGVEDPNSRSSSRTMISHAQPWIASERKALHSTSSSRASNYADTYGEKDDAPRSKKTIGGGINSNVPSSRTHQYSHNYNNSRSFSGQNSLDPAHAAYMSQDGRSSATPSPQPGYGNYPGAYNPNTSAPNPHPLRRHVQNFSRMHSREPSLDSRSSTPQPAATSTAAATTSAAPTGPSTVQEGFVMPPPPPRAAKVPSIAAPSVDRTRAPKKYVPPSISIEAAAAADQSSSSRPRYHKVDPPQDY